MEKMILKMGTIEVIGQRTYSFEHELLYLRAGAFSGSHLDVNSPPGGYVKSLEIERQVWQRFLLVLGATKSMIFAIKPDAVDRNWYENKAARAETIPWMSIDGYDASRELEFGASPDASTQIHDVKISSPVMSMPTMIMVGLTYTGMTKTVW